MSRFRWPRLTLPKLRLPRVSLDLLAFGLGLAAFVAGLAMIYVPAGLIGGGLVLMGVAVFGPGKEGAR